MRARTLAVLLPALWGAACTPTPTTAPDADLDAGADAATSDAATVDAWIPPVPATTIDAANAVMPGDPLFEGQQRFLYDTWDSEVFGEWPPYDFMVSLMTSEPDVFGNQFERFGFVPDPTRELPIGLLQGTLDPTLIHHNCSTCHVGRLPDGRLWIGMPNREMDLARFRYEVNARWVAAGHSPIVGDVDLAKAFDYGPGRFATESSDYPIAVPADLPPYWLLGDRTALNYLGTGGNIRTESFLAIFAFGVGDPTVMTASGATVPWPAAARVDPLVAFMGALTPPAAPPQDAALVAQGRTVFTRERCDSCHHVDDVAANGVIPYDLAMDGRDRFPGDDAAYPLGTIHTDYLHRILVDGPPPMDGGVDLDAGTTADDRANFLRFITRNRLAVRNSDGYRVDDLHGLWATAPYLHNGSVPTLEDLLRPAATRPTTFMRGDFVVDTTQPANGNGGHEFGTSISDADRAALVAYLNSL